MYKRFSFGRPNWVTINSSNANFKQSLLWGPPKEMWALSILDNIPSNLHNLKKTYKKHHITSQLINKINHRHKVLGGKVGGLGWMWGLFEFSISPPWVLPSPSSPCSRTLIGSQAQKYSPIEASGAKTQDPMSDPIPSPCQNPIHSWSGELNKPIIPTSSDKATL